MKDDRPPDRINKMEIMEYWGFHGPLRNVRYYARLIRRVILDAFARNIPSPRAAVRFHRWKGIMIGQQVYIGPRVAFDLIYPELITIEDNVSIGMDALIFAHANPTNSMELEMNHYPRRTARVVIKKGAWIAPGTIILPGVTINENAVAGAGSIVTKDVPPYTVVAGNPAKMIRKLITETGE